MTQNLPEPVTLDQYIWHLTTHVCYKSIRQKGLLVNENGRLYATLHLINPYCMWPMCIEIMFLSRELIIKTELKLIAVRIDTSKCQNEWFFDPEMPRMAPIHKKGKPVGLPLYVFTETAVPFKALSFFRFEEVPTIPVMSSRADDDLSDPECMTFKSFTGATLHLKQVGLYSNEE